MKASRSLTRFPVATLIVGLLLTGSTMGQTPAAASRPANNPFTLTKELAHNPCPNQGGTGTCWAFATTSFLESEVARQSGQLVRLSEIWFARAAIAEKAHRYVMLQGHAQFDEGGLSHDLAMLVEKYGAVPFESYTGLKEGKTTHDHKEMWTLLKAMVAPLAAEKAKLSNDWEAAILGLVDGYVGTPPKTVAVDGREVTPQAWAHDVLHLKGGDFVEVMSDGRQKLHGKGELLVPDNWMRYQNYENLPIDEFMAAFDHALATGFSVAVDVDVSEPGFSPGTGTATLPKKLEVPGAVTQEVRDGMFYRRDTTDDHLMHVVGVAKHSDGSTWYLTKNSWGPKGIYEGNMFISQNYLRAKMLGFMVHRDGMPKKTT